MWVAKVHVAPDDLVTLVSAAVSDTGNVLETEMLRPQLKAERSVRGLDRIANAGDQGNAELRAAGTDLVGEYKHARSRGEE
jgi:hypothetical protein